MNGKLLCSSIFLLALLFSVRVSGQLSGFYEEDFEGTFPPSGWQKINVSDPTVEWMQSTQYVYSGTHSAFLQWSEDYYVQGEDWLILPQFTVSASDSFSFRMAVPYTGFTPDSTWILVSTTDSSLSSFTSVLDTLSEGDNYPTDVGVFKYYSFSLSAFAGQEIYLAFKNRNIFGDGIYIDLVTIGSPPSIDASVVSIDVQDAVSTTYSIPPKATVKNNSSINETFTVTMNISGGYSSTKDVTNLAGGTSQQIIFDPWMPADSGDYTVSVQTQLAGDVVPSNDTLSKEITAYDPLMWFYQQDFEGTFPPKRWRVVDVLDPLHAWQQYSGFSYSGTKSAYLMYSPSSSEPGEDWLILPQYKVAEGDSFTFWFAIQFTGYPDTTSILVSTSDNELPNFTETLAVLADGDNYPSDSSSHTYYAFSLDSFIGQNIYIAFKNRNWDGDGIFVDHVSIGNPLATSVSESSLNDFGLSSYPNPFSKFGSVSFSLEHQAMVRVSVSDVTGKEMSMLCNKTLPAGRQQIEWDATEFSAGIYFCNVNVDGNIITKKLVKVK